MSQKHLTDFATWKPAWQLSAALVPTVIMYGDVWSFVEMDRWSVQHRIAAVELCITTESVTATQRGFRQQFQRRDVPNRNTLLLWVSKWRQEGSVKESQPQGRPFSVPAPDSVEQVRDAMLRIPRKSTRTASTRTSLNPYPANVENSVSS